MGNKLSFFMLHGKRLKNRYNAQYRAIEFIGKDKHAKAPRHDVPGITEITNDSASFQALLKKDLKLDEYLKDIYVRSHDEIPEESLSRKNNPNRPLPESREPKLQTSFNEPEEVEKGYCTLSEISQFIVHHDEDPVENNSAAIAKKYDLEERKVENTLKYFTIFRVYNAVEDTIPREQKEEDEMLYDNVMKELTSGDALYKELRKSLKKKAEAHDKTKRETESGEGYQPEEKAVKNR